MNRKFNSPFIKAAAIILVCILFISFGLASRSNSFLDNVAMLLSAFFSTITFLLGISAAIILSILILIGIFLGATAIHSPEKARELAGKIWSSIKGFSDIIKKFFLKKVEDIEHSEKLKEQKDYLTKQVNELSARMSQLSEKVKSSHFIPGSHDRKKESQEQDLSSQDTHDIHSRLNQLSNEISSLRNDFNELQTSIKQLSGSSSQTDKDDDLPPPLHLLRYIESDQEKELFLEYMNNTVRKKLSFAKSREYLLENLPDHLKELIEEHPRLTKDLIRHQRTVLRGS